MSCSYIIDFQAIGISKNIKKPLALKPKLAQFKNFV